MRAPKASPIPSREDINVFDSLDERSACENFLGKNLAEAEDLFNENFLTYQEDLMFMGPRAFRYYVQAAIRFITSNADGNDISFFLMVIRHRLEFERDEVKPVARIISDACGHVIENWPAFAEEAEAYGDILEGVIRLQSELEQLVDAQNKVDKGSE